MWLSPKIFSILEVAKESVDSLRQELAATRAERDQLKASLSIAQNNLEWIRKQINMLQFERTALLQKAYGIAVPTPEIVQTFAPQTRDIQQDASIFDDIGDEVARKMGLPVYGSMNRNERNDN